MGVLEFFEKLNCYGKREKNKGKYFDWTIECYPGKDKELEPLVFFVHKSSLMKPLSIVRI
jgi:hypothetical protein